VPRSSRVDILTQKSSVCCALTTSSNSTGSGVSVPVYFPVVKPLAVSANARQGISSWISSGGATVEARDRKSGKWCDAHGL